MVIGQRTPIVPAESLQRDLENAIEGQVRFDRHNRMLYSTDASLYQVEPIGVVIPASVDDAVEAIRVCARAGVPILPRGGGTSLAGQCTNRAVVIDFSPNCRRVLEVNAAARTARVEPGVTVDELNDHLTSLDGAASGLFFAPDPATSRHANIGGCIGNNAAGARSIRYGRTSESLLALDVCLANGTRARFEKGAALHHPDARALTQAVCDAVARHAAAIRERFPKTVRRNAGFGLDMILHAMERGGWRSGAVSTEHLAEVNLAHLVCGSEGTLAVTLGAELTLHPKPAAKGLAVVGFDSLDAAIERVVPILATNPSAIELLDDTVIDLARANTEYRRYVELMPRPVGGELKAVLYVEYFGENGDEIARSFDSLRRTVAGESMEAHTNAAAMLNAWKLRKAGEPLLHGIPGHRKPLTFIEDNAVPVENLSAFVTQLRKIVTQHGTTAAYYAHASVGVLHVRPLIDLHDERDRERLRSIAVAAADLARSLGGVMSGEHGDGRVRTPLLERFFGPELMGAFREVKRLFDPADLLNPGNIVDLTGHNPRPLGSITQNLRVDAGFDARPTTPPPPAPSPETYFDYTDQHGFDGAVELCNGAGVCRKKQGGAMCPSYMATLDERHCTRGRGNALRLAITGQFDGEGRGGLQPNWSDPGTIETLDLCLSCKACKTECPSNVDIARLKAEYTAQRYRERGAPLAARVMGVVRMLNRLGSALAPIANWASTFGPTRAAMNAILGIHPDRSIPRFAASLAHDWRPASGTGRPRPVPEAATPRVALFGDCFTMFNEPGIGLATRRVYEAFGYGVDLANAGCCGRAKISLGLLPQAILEIDDTLERLRPFIEGRHVEAILVAEPSCLSAIKDDWLALKLRTPIALRRRLAEKAFLPEHFLDARWDQHPRRPTLGQPGETVLLHAHCHQKALWGAETSAAILKRVGHAQLRVLDSGCCGMAGSFGYSKGRYDLSMRIGELSLFPALRASPGAIVCAPGTSCRHQIHDGVGARAIHPIELLERLLPA
ncbi:hypothetical protein PHYC_00222 [Phycisphaerales bacterium]|nr:hypothetical protein PHYC_00222 [Phycisphaerales bacterium]